ncbi:MAG: hypothetical protein ABI690_31955 [Chloroflexota bacterium]
MSKDKASMWKIPPRIVEKVENGNGEKFPIFASLATIFAIFAYD